MNDDEVVYKCLPPISELVNILKPQKKISHLDRWKQVLLEVIIFAVIIMFGCVLFMKLALLPKRETGFVGLIFTGVAMLAWMVSVVIEIFQGAGILLNPANELAEQFDRDMAMELRLLPRFRAIPATVLMARHQSIELQLQAWEKWLDTVRFMGLLGPPFIFVVRGAFGKLVPLSGAWTIEIMVSAFLTGVMLGAISFRSGMKRLHRISSLLKRSAELRQARELPRRRLVS